MKTKLFFMLLPAVYFSQEVDSLGQNNEKKNR